MEEEAFYNLIANDYVDAIHTSSIHKDIDTPTVLKAIGTLSQDTILDIGCGDGNWTRKLRNLTTGEVFGVDLSEKMIEIAQ